MTTIVLTRPHEASRDFRDEIRMPGMKFLIAPMLDIVPLGFSVPVLEPFGGYIFTSSNGIACFLGSAKADCAAPVFAVGHQTARAARDAGFTDVVDASGTAEDLIRAIVDADPAGMLLHPCGKDTSADVPALLARHGYQAAGLPVYEARKTELLPDPCREALRAGEVSAVLFFSARAGENFCKLVATEDLAGCTASINALSLSERVVKSIGQLPWRNMYISPAPDRDGMLDLLRSLYGE